MFALKIILVFFSHLMCIYLLQLDARAYRLRSISTSMWLCTDFLISFCQFSYKTQQSTKRCAICYVTLDPICRMSVYAVHFIHHKRNGWKTSIYAILSNSRETLFHQIVRTLLACSSHVFGMCKQCEAPVSCRGLGARVLYTFQLNAFKLAMLSLGYFSFGAKTRTAFTCRSYFCVFVLLLMAISTNLPFHLIICVRFFSGL